MLKAIRQLWAPVEERQPASVPAGQRVYAIGDVHGRLDLLVAMAEVIEADIAARGAADVAVILLGDLIDRGPDSAGVLAAVRMWRNRRDVRALWGNHEEMFLRSFEDLNVFRNFLVYGGEQTILSYGVDPRTFEAADLRQAQVLMAQAVPEEDRAFIESFADYAVIGDYLFVHAGIDPGKPLDEQRPEVMRWIREPFLSHSPHHQHMVVHGHTIAARPQVSRNRIGIDTGAYMSGRLTALGLEGDRRWLIEVAERDGKRAVDSRAV